MQNASVCVPHAEKPENTNKSPPPHSGLPMTITACITYPYGHITWENGGFTVAYKHAPALRCEYLTDYQSRVGYPAQHLSGEYALQLLLPNGCMGLNPQPIAHHTNNGTLQVSLADDRYPQIVIQLTAQLTEEGIYTQQVSIINGTADTLQLIRAYSLSVLQQAQSYHVTTFRGVWAGEHVLQEQEVKRGNTLCTNTCTGIKTAQEGMPAMLLSANGSAQEESGSCLLASLCWSGNYTISFTHNAQGIGFLGLGHDFAQAPYTIAPGQGLDLPKALLVYSQHGKGDTTRRLHSYLRRNVIPHGTSARRTLLNSWEGVHFDISEPTLLQMVKKTADLGIDLFVLDDGWFGKRRDDRSSLGDWYPDAERLPQGLTPIANAAATHGIGFGLWMEPEMVCPDSELYRSHPEWAIQLPGIAPTTQRHQLVLNLALPEVEAYICEAVGSIFSQNPGISYIKWDCNRMLTDAAHPNIYFDYVVSYYRIMRSLRIAFPGVCFQCCSAGGGRMDHGAARYHEEFWLSDNTDAQERLRMQWSASHLFPANTIGAHVTASPNLYTGRYTSLKFRFDVALAGRLGFELDPRCLTPEETEEIQHRLQLYRQLAPLTQLGDLYRLVSPYDGPDCAMLYTDGKQALVLAYTTERAFTDQYTRIPIRGIKPDTHYHIRELMPDTTGNHCPANEDILAGEELLLNGLPLRWNRPLQSAVILLTPCP